MIFSDPEKRINDEVSIKSGIETLSNINKKINQTKNTKLAIITDQLAGGLGGAEYITFTAARLYPDAPIYTTVCDNEILPEDINKRGVKTTFIQNLPNSKKLYKAYLPLMPTAIEYLDLQDYDVIFSSHHCVAKGIIPRPDAVHICYCHSPARYVWDMFWTYLGLNNASKASSLVSSLLCNYFRVWDITSSNRVDHFLANSSYTAARIKRFYNRDSEILFPPVDTGKFRHETYDDYYLMISRLVGYKRFDLAIEAFNESGKNLIIIGDGVEFERYKKMAKPNVKLLGKVSNQELYSYMNRCRGFIFPGIEDFGIVMAEAQAAGKPVIAFKAGGALDIVVDKDTGILFDQQSVKAVNEAIKLAENIDWDNEMISAHAKKFDQKTFVHRLRYILENPKDFSR